jgi:hypothetical protein
MKFRPRSSLTLAIIVALGFGIVTALRWPLRASILVLTIGTGCWLLAVIQLFRELRPEHQVESSGMDVELTEEQQLSKAPLRALDIWTWLIACVIGIWLFGLYIAISLWSFLYAYKHGSRWWVALIIAILCWGVIWGLFDQLVHMPFPQPLLPLPRVLTG